MIRAAADDIDAQIGHIYKTPIEVDDTPRNRPTRLLLKKINNLIASGRMLMDMAAAGSDDNTHAYGLFLLREGMDLLRQIQTGEIDLIGADRIEGDGEAVGPAAPSIHNEDDRSLVQAFYDTGRYGRIFTQPTLPYGAVNN